MKVLTDVILLYDNKKANKVVGGLSIPESVANFGLVFEVGEDVKRVRRGDRVYYVGTAQKLVIEGKSVLVIRETDLLVVINGDTDAIKVK